MLIMSILNLSFKRDPFWPSTWSNHQKQITPVKETPGFDRVQS